jgi:cytochrome c
VKLYAVFTNPQWSAEKPDLLALDWLHFNGRGVEKHPATKVSLTATPATGTAPLAVKLASKVEPLPGRTIASYHWDFGDNTKPTAPEGATAAHSYARSGAYTAHLTVTDNKGDTTVNYIRINVS